MGEQMAATPYTSCATGVPLGNGDTAPLAEPLAEAVARIEAHSFGAVTGIRRL